jgi:hypothetical protein
MNADDLADIRADLVAAVNAAINRVGRAELPIDRRLWTPEERDEYLDAHACYAEAYEKLAAFDAANPEQNHAQT